MSIFDKIMGRFYVVVLFVVLSFFVAVIVAYGFIPVTYESTASISIRKSRPAGTADGACYTCCDEQKSILGTYTVAERATSRLSDPHKSSAWLIDDSEISCDEKSGVLKVSVLGPNPRACAAAANAYADAFVEEILQRQGPSNAGLPKIKDGIGKYAADVKDEYMRQIKEYATSTMKMDTDIKAFDDKMRALTDYQLSRVGDMQVAGGTEIKIIDRARANTEPVSPNRKKIIFEFFLAGIFTGCVIAVRLHDRKSKIKPQLGIPGNPYINKQ